MDHRVYLGSDGGTGSKPRKEKPKAAFSRDEDGWVPDLNPKQLDFYWDDSPYCLAYGERYSGKCLDVNSLIYTDQGLVRLKDLKPDTINDNVGDINVGVFNEEGPARAMTYYDEPDETALEIELDNGQRQAVSPRHKIWCERDGEFGWIKSPDIKDSDREVWIPLHECPSFPSETITVHHFKPNYRRYIREAIERNPGLGISAIAVKEKLPYETIRYYMQGKAEWHTELTDELGYVVGLLTGDGCLGNGFVGLTTADEEIIEAISPTVAELGCSVEHVEGYGYAIRSGGKPNRFISLIKALRLDCGSYDKHIPAEILRSPRSVLSAFLRGLYDADGTIDKNGTISLNSVSEGLIDDSQAALQALGVFSVKRPKKKSWNLYSSGHASDEFMEHVGFGLSRKRDRYTKRLRNPHRGFYPPSIKARWKEVVAENLNGHRSTRHDQSGTTIRTRAWHSKHRHIIQCRNTPRPEKVEALCNLFDCHERFADYRRPLRWVKVTCVRSVRRKLADISVPGGHRFLANGMLHHNTYCGLDKMVRHCYQHDNALAIIVVLIKTSAKAGGAWEQLLSETKDHAGRHWGTLKKWNEAVGLRYTDEYGDDAKNKWIDIETVNGGTSSILLLSMPHGANIADRIKNMTPSYIHIEELSNTKSKVYFTKPIQQLGRHPGVPSSAQQFVATCNPGDEGEKNWVFQQFFVHKATNPRGGKQPGYDPNGYNVYTKKNDGWNTNFGVHHLPSHLNDYVEDMEGYQAKIMEDMRDDPTAYDRLIKGLWVAKITGDALFAKSYDPDIHLRGEPGKTGLLPIRGYPIIIGYDPGDSNNARTFMQRVPYKGRWFWRVIDAIANFNEHTHYEDLIRDQLDVMAAWNKRMNYVFDYEHIGDKAMYTHFNPQGSYDYLEFYRISKRLIAEYERFAQLSPIRVKAPDKGDGSVGERVRCVRNCLHSERLLISALAPEVDDMFRYLKKAKGVGGVEIDDKPQKTKRGHIHTFDSTSYPIYYYEANSIFDDEIYDDDEELSCGTFG